VSRVAPATRAGIVFVAIVVAALCVSAAVRLPCRDVCGSDLGRLYEARGIDRAHAPLLDRDLEYPPLVGLVMYAAGYPFDGALRASFLLNVLVLVTLAAVTTWLLWRRYGRRVDRWVFAPPLWLEGVINWDLLSVAPATAGLLRWEAGGAFWAGVLVGIGASAKLAPALYAPILAASCVPSRAWARARDFVVGSVIGAGALAIPLYLVAPDALGHFFEFHGARSPTWGTIWFYGLRDPAMHPWVPRRHLAVIGTVITAVVVIGALAVLVAGAARARLTPIAACALATIAFIVANKVYSPQYDLWLVPFLVMLPVRTKLVVHFYASSVFVFVCSFGFSHAIGKPGS
jgi:hypothetical protein